MRTYLFSAFAIAMLCTGNTPSIANAYDPQLLRITTGSVSGVYYEIGIELCRTINKRRYVHMHYCVVEGSSGSSENLLKLASGASELAIAQSNALAVFISNKNETTNDLEVLASLYNEALHVFVRADSNIAKFADFKGKRINLSERGSGTRVVVDDILEFADLKKSDFPLVLELDPISQISALCEDRIDVSFWVSATPNLIASEILDRCDVVLMDLADIVGEQEIVARGYKISKLSPEDYRGLGAPISSLSVEAVLVKSVHLSDETVSVIAGSISEGQVVLQRNSRFLGGFEFFDD
ncbi:TAXI family TRAP transporter solute-binding subunit [Roseobacter sp. EG26]|uniref:TAXI family TRAP transporter solute-binding subunit n=1 Tax=Roseobacter sp. EG26 TaxID=3412477 RepID=UPI003CE464A0